eukprot:CAMPEP_0174699504 /NCGR_PEP_ID=MMETSP1094-20130205/4767_1 /TAXON_ID=156173 /ORGANISM="Chrysochromulina brevifilum, Strain UTEX LB 985" /LENGTH=302 /DNA_ID=CAMNT_0015896859 /DNA_START=640 /DNA_END=1549 /DNA_ORIENTATION=+
MCLLSGASTCVSPAPWPPAQSSWPRPGGAAPAVWSAAPSPSPDAQRRRPALANRLPSGASARCALQDNGGVAAAVEEFDGGHAPKVRLDAQRPLLPQAPSGEVGLYVVPLGRRRLLLLLLDVRQFQVLLGQHCILHQVALPVGWLILLVPPQRIFTPDDICRAGRLGVGDSHRHHLQRREHVLAREYRPRVQQHARPDRRRAAVHHEVDLARLARNARVSLTHQSRQVAQGDAPTLRSAIEGDGGEAVHGIAGDERHDHVVRHGAMWVALQVDGVCPHLGRRYDEVVEHLGFGGACLGVEME